MERHILLRPMAYILERRRKRRGRERRFIPCKSRKQREFLTQIKDAR
jgi:hypothetical protein